VRSKTEGVASITDGGSECGVLASESTPAAGARASDGGSQLEQHVRDLEFLLRHVALIVKQRGREILSNFDITPPQFNALLELVHNGNLTMGDLCARLYLASSTVTDLVDRMERANLVMRERDPSDRRVVRLQALAKGHDLIEAVMKARLDYLRGILQRVDAGERSRLIEALRHLHDVMKDAELAT
ncbi:MAG TPA: MarR family transcriptional regulator, partial [Bacillota bacterium]